MKQLQIIVHVLLVNVAFPAATTIFLGIIMGLLTFEFYDFGPFYDRILRLDPESVGNSPLNNRFNLMGYQYLYIVKNLGSFCLIIFTILLLFAACSVLAFIKHKIFQTAKIWMQK